MSIVRSTGALIGTDESTGVTLANNTLLQSSLLDMLGDNASIGDVWLYLVFTTSTTSGVVNLRFNAGRRANSGTEEYQRVNYEFSIAPISGTQKIPLGKRSCPRYLAVDVYNNGLGVNITNLSVLYELEKIS